MEIKRLDSRVGGSNGEMADEVAKFKLTSHAGCSDMVIIHSLDVTS